MKDREALQMIRAAVVESAVITRDLSQGLGWEIWLDGENLPSGTSNAVELARGGRRTWASLDTAYAWLQSASVKGLSITIEQRF